MSSFSKFPNEIAIEIFKLALASDVTYPDPKYIYWKKDNVPRRRVYELILNLSVRSRACAMYAMEHHASELQQHLKKLEGQRQQMYEYRRNHPGRLSAWIGTTERKEYFELYNEEVYLSLQLDNIRTELDICGTKLKQDRRIPLHCYCWPHPRTGPSRRM
ncbi:MAG: hypothetical protein M1831_004027 [Alyxoria varia]|nr:MAG: hypothetical protein M1831_004027 [Alyxoria varia]